MSDNAFIRILIADDHTVVRSGVAAIVNAQSDMEVTGEADNGPDAVTRYFDLRPDVALIDLQMPGLDGVGVIRAIRDREPGAKLIILTTYDTDEEVESGLRAGARAYLLKDVRPADLVACIREVAAGKLVIAPAVAARLAQQLTRLQLTARELEVLRLIANGMTNKDIGNHLHIAESTVKLHTRTLFEKLNVTTRTEAMRIGIQRGLVRIR